MGGRLIILSIDLPYPPNYGHKVDQYNRWKGFADAGWALRLVCWRSPRDPPAAPGDAPALAGIFERIDELPIGYDPMSLIRRLIHLVRYPSHVASRIPDRATCRRLVAQALAFSPDAIVLDGIYGGVLGRNLARACAVPLIVRGHNVEHSYFRGQVRAASTLLKKLRWTLARLGLRRYETALLREVAWTFDISTDDIAYWRMRGISRLSWAPTVYPGAVAGTAIPPAERRFDVAYIGNMRLPNNIEGIGWFLREVWPQVRALRPGTSCCFAGANPAKEVVALLEWAPGITVIPDAPSADAILADGRVLINPILSGSGVNVKSIDMLRYDAQVITTPVGSQGFPPAVREQFVVCANARSFAQAIVAALADPGAGPGRAEVRALFGQAGLDAQIAAYARVVAGEAAA